MVRLKVTLSYCFEKGRCKTRNNIGPILGNIVQGFDSALDIFLQKDDDEELSISKFTKTTWDRNIFSFAKRDWTCWRKSRILV